MTGRCTSLWPRAAIFGLALFALCLPALLWAQPTSVVLEQNHRGSGGNSLIAVRWAAPASGTVSEYKVRWAKGEGSTAWLNAGGAAGVSAAGTLSYTIQPTDDDGNPGNLDDGRYDVQVAATVSGATTWSAVVCIVVGTSSLNLADGACLYWKRNVSHPRDRLNENEHRPPAHRFILLSTALRRRQPRWAAGFPIWPGSEPKARCQRRDLAGDSAVVGFQYPQRR